MNLYKILLKYGYAHQMAFTFFAVANNLKEAEDLALETFKKYNYGDCHLHNIELIASEGQYAEPDILIIGLNQ